MKKDLTEIKTWIDINAKEVDEAKESLSYLKEKIEKQKELIQNIEKAIKVLTDVLAITQHEIIGYIENVVTTALNYIYGSDYKFKIDFKLRRNQPEADIYVMKDDLRYDFRNSCGVGILNTVSFALRCACWSLINPPSNPILVFDEPFSSISGLEQLAKAETMIKKLSEMLNIQIILVSGKRPLTDNFNNVIEIEMKEGESVVR